MLDFTKEIKLDAQSYKLYRKLQLALYLIIFFLLLYLSYLIIFPHKYFSFSFLNPASDKNTMDVPLIDNAPYQKKAVLLPDGLLTFNTSIIGDYSNVKIKITLDNDSSASALENISIRRSYQAFMQNEGEPIGFKEGSLLKNNSNFYIISDGKIRKFLNFQILSDFGYQAENFTEVSGDELNYNARGETIDQNNDFPNGTLFKIEENYYILENKKLKKFVSSQAYLSQYEDSKTLKKGADFLNKYTAAEELAGFSDGTLASNGESVYILSEKEFLPIDSVQTFESKGYDWANVTAIGGDELAIYKKGKLFNIKSAHPNGTIFKTVEDSAYYMIENGQKHLLPSQNITFSWTKKGFLPASQKALEIYAECFFEKSFLSAKKYSCEIPLDKFQSFLGSDYGFNLASKNKIGFESLEADYRKNINKNNLKNFLLTIFNSIKIKYGLNTTN